MWTASIIAVNEGVGEAGESFVAGGDASFLVSGGDDGEDVGLAVSMLSPSSPGGGGVTSITVVTELCILTITIRLASPAVPKRVRMLAMTGLFL